MKYFFIAGEASGDLHARHLMDAIRREDVDAEVYYWYKPELAYMGFVSVAIHLPEILRGMRMCKEAIRTFKPDKLILIDYPGFNLKIAAWFHNVYIKKGRQETKSRPEVIYYIPPKIWAWKEHRITQMRQYVDRVLSILPFEVQWYAQKHNFHIDYVGNPTLDEIVNFKNNHTETDISLWRQQLDLDTQHIVAMLPGSRRQEIERNLPMMLRAAKAVGGNYKYVIASAPNIDKDLYNSIIASTTGTNHPDFLRRIVLAPCHGSKSSFMLMSNAHAAMVTSGTATLETAIFGIPQVVCYAMACGKIVSMLRRIVLKVKYVSLVNLIVGAEVVPELVAGDMTQQSIEKNLRSILLDNRFRQKQMEGYSVMKSLLGTSGAPKRAAHLIVNKAFYRTE